MKSSSDNAAFPFERNGGWVGFLLLLVFFKKSYFSQWPRWLTQRLKFLVYTMVTL